MSDNQFEENPQVRVLVVEDDDLQAEVLATQLAAAGFKVDIVADGLAAVWKVREGCHDVVLIDYGLPEIDGFATARLVCDFMQRPARPVLIALTANLEHLNTRLCGVPDVFDAVLAKSSDLSAVFSVIAGCLASQPERTQRQEALFSLLLQSWLDFDTESPRPGALGDDPGPGRILVIEDDDCQQAFLKSALEHRGYVADVAFDGLDAVRKIRGGCYDVALVDYNLPEFDGMAAGRLIYETIQEGTRPRLIAFTATPDLVQARQGPGPGIFDEVLQKSADLQGLMYAIDRHMRTSPNPTTRRAAALTGSAGKPKAQATADLVDSPTLA